jgi:hypothetical protein
MVATAVAAVAAVAAAAVAAAAAKALVATVVVPAEEKVAGALKAAWETAVAEAEVEGWVEAILAGRSAAAAARRALRVANTHSAARPGRRTRCSP